MEQITRTDGVYYYGNHRCRSVDEVYLLFRTDYHNALGKAVHNRLDRVGQRTERIHGYGFDFSEGCEPESHGYEVYGKTPYWLAGLVGTSYCRMVRLWDMPPIEEEDFENWSDWVFTRGRKALKMLGKNRKVGRTSKRLKTRYR